MNVAVQSQKNCLMPNVFSGRYYGVDAELNDISTCLVIDLEDNNLSPGMIKTLADALSQTAPKIKELRFKDTKMNDEIFQSIFHVFSLQHLNHPILIL